ncbi:MAG: hypothetical protein ABSH26_04550 [Opitutaceae bacterium]|jgi:hypothetical protein
MSLINDALKKAARQRAEEQADIAPLAQTGRRKRIPRHGAPMSAQTLVLLAAGAVTLIVASVVITGILITGRLEPRAAAVATPLPATPAPKPPPVVVVQVPRPADLPVAPVRQPAPQPPTAAPVAQAAPPAAAAAEPAARVAAAEPAPRPAAAEAPKTPATPPPSRGDQVQSFVDGLRVTGVRAAGSDSKALVDGHIYRVNDFLDRALGVRLVQVDPDHLTLVDSQGVTYIKSF